MENTSRKIILPGDPEFDLTLGLNLPPNWGQVAHQTWGQTACIARAESGLLEAVSGEELIEYLEGGEYDQRLAEIDEDEFEGDEFEGGW
ncbi:MAG: hypothetical protein HC833_21830 [Leptolyngbyaceae cyanobacterium RM1_406_9]|nr:hypothetical protein [Leptolyngbyaceae cyanobacterium RM1_406_9]